ncbi:helix-turn-helix transcriptional regulator [Lutispora saccharofermentans]|uniref:Helix-turn-helix transcriptional regulator n=1 Tax=Lutispora saccharofermentans TaxID=3024236 RepID=A0ABT1NAY6_9FIRM|nr:helix-turn-helix transcriptional regulator [Lutispora saccharofermentans]MCQ1528413.1 helix-turn-helix transcriptional regulator [Lutispora saccharofermentans]
MINSVGSKIKNLRIKKKMTQAQLCGSIINRCVLSLIENNKMQPSISQLNHFCKVLDVPVTYFTSNIDYSQTISSIGTDDGSDLNRAFAAGEYEYIAKLYEHDSVKFNTIEDINKYYYLGMSYYNIKTYKESALTLRKYINSFSKKPESYRKSNFIEYATALNTLSKIYMQRSNYKKAEEYLNIAFNFLIRLHELNSLIYCIVINNLSLIYNYTAQYKKTYTLINDFFNTHDNLTYRVVAPQLHIAMNIACYNLGKYSEAIEHIQKSILLLNYENDAPEIGRCYINYINVLRYCCRFSEAFEIVEKCKKDFYDNKVLYRKFSMQELILYFNIKDYPKAEELLGNINVNSLQEMGKNNYRFIAGHISFIHNEYEKALKNFNNCEKYFLKNMYHYDLALIYDDLFAITGDKLYLEKKKASLLHDAVRRNVLIDVL